MSVSVVVRGGVICLTLGLYGFMKFILKGPSSRKSEGKLTLFFDSYDIFVYDKKDSPKKKMKPKSKYLVEILN